ncbi:hypothetical protein [Paraburkholderia bannensis]|uniref:hypothetical protein n=1 Tax=Paraburkholderia bannensis TaxID=765414 RepID=UPI000693AEBD|nr:hypothetical protein [Paraburkholderia bannensis]
MDNEITEVQRNAIIDVLQEAMLILRSNKAIELENSAFGKLSRIEDQYKQPGYIYHYTNSQIPEGTIILATADDPLDYSEDRARVATVPSKFELYFYVTVRGITPSMLKERLNLADFWISSNGKKNDYNDMGPGIPPMPLLHRYRYRANGDSSSQFPVDVELFYGDGPLDAPPGTQPSLGMVIINRAYPYLTPEMRKKKRDEAAAARAQTAYGKGASQ